MSNYHLLSDVLYHHENIAARKKNPLLPSILLLGGIALTLWSLVSPAMAESKNLSSSLLLIGCVMMLFGLIGLVLSITGKKPVFAPTGEKLTRKELFFEARDKHTLLAAFEAGDMEKISRIPRGHSSNILLLMYATASGSCMLAQVQEYVPHEFVAVTDVARFSGEQARNVAVAA